MGGMEKLLPLPPRFHLELQKSCKNNMVLVSSSGDVTNFFLLFQSPCSILQTPGRGGMKQNKN